VGQSKRYDHHIIAGIGNVLEETKLIPPKLADHSEYFIRAVEIRDKSPESKKQRIGKNKPQNKENKECDY